VSEHGRGLVLAVVAYTLWGLLPLYWPLLEPAGAMEILAHRLAWSLVVSVVLLLVSRGSWRWIKDLVRDPRRLGLVVAASVAITINWAVYIWAVNSGQVVETSLGYFINPIMTVALGVLVLHERLRRVQWAAVGLGAAAVAVLIADEGGRPWIALTLALTFSTYGLIKKFVNLPGLRSFTAETAVMFLPAASYIAYLQWTGSGTFTQGAPVHPLLLAGAGVVTAGPLVCFASAAIRVPLSTFGMVQYLAPVFQFVIGVAVFHERLTPLRWAGIALVWLALAVLVTDGLRTMRRSRTRVAATLAVGSVSGEA
jgi:chloramphenicol-sensitive protein RarD